MKDVFFIFDKKILLMMFSVNEIYFIIKGEIMLFDYFNLVDESLVYNLMV